jgi:hypothetical protein
MPFPFYWIGALLAGLVLAGAMTVFGLALEAVARVTHGVRGSVLPGLVAGFREWRADAGTAVHPDAGGGRSAPPSSLEDILPLDSGPLERVHPRVI